MIMSEENGKKQKNEEATAKEMEKEMREEKKERAENGAGGKENEYYDQLLRLKAEFENYRKRVEKEKPELIKWGKAEVFLELLPLYDLLVKAHSHIKNVETGEEKLNKKEVKEIIAGLEMIFKQFSKVFKSEGIREIEVLGKEYDPMACEVLGVVEGDAGDDGKVVEELEKGYYFEDKILRTCKVKIAKKKALEKNKEK